MRQRCSAMMPGLSCRLVHDLTSASIMPAARVPAIRSLPPSNTLGFFFARERVAFFASRRRKATGKRSRIAESMNVSIHDARAASNGHERYWWLGTIENIDSAANTITIRLSDGTDKITVSKTNYGKRSRGNREPCGEFVEGPGAGCHLLTGTLPSTIRSRS